MNGTQFTSGDVPDFSRFDRITNDQRVHPMDGHTRMTTTLRETPRQRANIDTPR